MPSGLLKTRRYLLFWVSSLLSNLGTWMQQVAQPWIMLTLSHSSFLVGLDSFAMNAPGWILTLWGGSLADRLDRKKVIIFFQSIQFLAILALIILLVTNLLRPWSLILISIIVGATDSLSMPSFQTIVPSLVEEDEIPRATTLNSIQFNLARTLGPASAGIVMTQFGALACVGANAISFIPFFLSIFWIFPKQSIIIKDPSVKVPIGQLIKQHGLRNQLLVVFAAMLFASPLFTFCSVIVTEIFAGQAKEFGTVSTAFGLGGLVGAMFAYFFGMKFSPKTPGILGLGLGIIIIGIAVSHSLLVMIMLMASAGTLLTLVNTATNSNIQMLATNLARGRFASLYQLSFRGGIALGSILTGIMAAKFGIKNAFLINGILVIIFEAALLRKTGKINYAHSIADLEA